MTIAVTYEERMALIREIAARKNKMKRIKAESKTVFRKAPKAKRKMMDVPNDNDDNPNYWTDASKYAEEFYGDRMRQTTRWDNDWGDY